MKSISVLILGWCFASLPAVSQDWDAVLLVGVGDYASPQVQDLAGPANDVQTARAYFTGIAQVPDNQIVTLVDQQATKQAILGAIETQLLALTEPGDRVFVYFSGHGSQLPDGPDGDEPDGRDETILPHDADTQGGGSLHLTDDELSRAFSTIEDRFVVFLADSCHSGTLSRSVYETSDPIRARYHPPSGGGSGPASIAREPAPALDSNTVGGIDLVISAVAADELAYEMNGSGVFTQLFFDALSSAASDMTGDGRVSVREALSVIEQPYADWCREWRSCYQRFTRLTPTVVPEFRMGYDLRGRSIDFSPVEHIENTFAGGDLNVSLELRNVFDQRKSEFSPDDGFVKFHVTSSIAREAHLTLFYLDKDGGFNLKYPSGQETALGSRAIGPEGVAGFTPKEWITGIPQDGHWVVLVSDNELDPALLGDIDPDAIDGTRAFIEVLSDSVYQMRLTKPRQAPSERAIDFVDVEPSEFGIAIAPFSVVSNF